MYSSSIRRTKRLPCVLLILAIFVGADLPVSARITRSRRSASDSGFGPTPSVWAPLYGFVLGSGVEYQTDGEQTEWGFPILVEYNFTERFKLTLEPKYGSIVSKSPDVRSVNGFGDFETTLTYEFLRERRYRPALSVEGGIRWEWSPGGD